MSKNMQATKKNPQVPTPGKRWKPKNLCRGPLSDIHITKPTDVAST